MGPATTLDGKRLVTEVLRQDELNQSKLFPTYFSLNSAREKHKNGFSDLYVVICKMYNHPSQIVPFLQGII